MKDCLIIGHYQVDYEDYTESLKTMGYDSGSFRDFNINYFTYDGVEYHGARAFNQFCGASVKNNTRINLVETFSAAIGYLGSFLTKHGYSFDYIKSFTDQREELKEKLLNGGIRTIAITTTLYVIPQPIIEIIQFIRQYNQEVKIILGGPFVSSKIQILEDEELEFLFQSIGGDIYIDSSQGEATLISVLDAIKNDKDFADLKNIHYKTQNGFLKTEKKVEKNPLEENRVQWELFGTDIGDFVNIRSAISCPFACAFCGFPEHAGKYQYTPVDFLQKELDEIEKIGTVKSVFFLDDTFNVPKERFKEILQMLIERNYSFSWHSFFRCQFADDETIRMMKESKCESVFLGIESGSDIILKNMNKKVTIAEYRRGVALLKKYEISSYGNFIVGFPGETEETVAETAAFIEESGIDYYRAQLWYCDHITPIWRNREEYDLDGSGFEWEHNTMNSSQACDHIEGMIRNIKTPRVPQYYFDYDNLVQFKYKGMTKEMVNEYLNLFNEAIIEKLDSQNYDMEVSEDILERMQLIGVNEELVEEPAESVSDFGDDFDF